MGKIRQMIRVGAHLFWTLFDGTARNSYVVPTVARFLATNKAPQAFRVVIGGQSMTTDTDAILCAEIEGYAISAHVWVVDQIGTHEEGREIEILIGTLTTKQWGIRPIPDEERLDLSHYPEEFVEF